MTTTIVREPVAPRRERRAALAPTRFEAVPDRCVVEAVLRARRLAVWRVRLRPIAVALTLYDGSQPSALTAQVAVRPRFASIPGTLGLFLPDAPRTEHIALSTAQLPPLVTGTTVHAPALVTVGAVSRSVMLRVETVRNDGDRMVLAISGAVERAADGPLPGCAMHIDAAVEFRRWS